MQDAGLQPPYDVMDLHQIADQVFVALHNLVPIFLCEQHPSWPLTKPRPRLPGVPVPVPVPSGRASKAGTAKGRPARSKSMFFKAKRPGGRSRPKKRKNQEELADANYEPLELPTTAPDHAAAYTRQLEESKRKKRRPLLSAAAADPAASPLLGEADQVVPRKIIKRRRYPQFTRDMDCTLVMAYAAERDRVSTSDRAFRISWANITKSLLPSESTEAQADDYLNRCRRRWIILSKEPFFRQALAMSADSAVLAAVLDVGFKTGFQSCAQGAASLYTEPRLPATAAELNRLFRLRAGAEDDAQPTLVDGLAVDGVSPGQRFTVVKKAAVRRGVALDSPPVGSLPVGDIIEVLEVGRAPGSGTVRVRVALGWTSVTARAGFPLLVPVDGSTARSGVTPALAALGQALRSILMVPEEELQQQSAVSLLSRFQNGEIETAIAFMKQQRFLATVKGGGRRAFILSSKFRANSQVVGECESIVSSSPMLYIALLLCLHPKQCHDPRRPRAALRTTANPCRFSKRCHHCGRASTYARRRVAGTDHAGSRGAGQPGPRAGRPDGRDGGRDGGGDQPRQCRRRRGSSSRCRAGGGGQPTTPEQSADQRTTAVVVGEVVGHWGGAEA